jgi:hypothetical protein
LLIMRSPLRTVDETARRVGTHAALVSATVVDVSKDIRRAAIAMTVVAVAALLLSSLALIVAAGGGR